MAKNKIQIDVMVNGKMEKATVSAKKLRKALDGAQNSQEQLNTSTRKGYRAAQGAAQNTSNSTKAFSKQAGVVRGLVPVYASIAANVFAISAAFGVLSRNAAVQQLETSLNNIGIAAGRNLPLVASNLKDITGGAISTEAALRATAVATTSGFSTKQLQDLTKVATGASIALGRNLPDALDRLVRGTAKLEPEILDELGIIVRLDQATREYAASLGKTAQELTQFERQQAFLNATIDQGLSKYEKVAQAVDPNPYDRLSAAFTDLLKSSIELANKGLVPIIEFLAESPSGLFAALGLFSTTIVSQIIPAISDMAAASADRFAMTAKDAKKAAKKITNEYADAAKDIQVLDFMPKGFKANADLLKAGTKDAKVYNDSLKSLRISQSKRVIEIEKVKAASADLSGFQKQASQQYLATKEAELAAIELEIQRTLELQRIQQQGFIGPVVVGGGSVQKAQKEARVTGARARSQDIEKKGLDDIGAAAGPLAALGVFASTIPQFIDNLGDLDGATEKTKQGFRSLGSAGKLLGATLSRLLGPLSLILLAYSVLGPVIQDIFFKEDKLAKATEEAANSFTNITKIILAFKKELVTIDSSVERTYRTLEVAAGITDQTAGALAKLQETADNITLASLNDEIQKLLDAQALLDGTRGLNFSEILSATSGATSDQIATVNIAAANKEIERLLDTIGKVPKANALVVLTSKLKLLEKSGATKLFPEIRTTYDDLIASLKKGDPNELVELDPLVDSLDDSSIGFKTLESATKASAQALQEFDAARAKLTAGDRTRYSQSIKAGQRYVNELTAQVTQLENAGTSDATQFGRFGDTVKLSELSKGDQAQAKFLEDKLGVSIATGGQLIRQQEVYNKQLLKAEDTLVTNKGILKEQQAIQKRINKLASAGGGFIEAQLKQEEEVRETKVEVLDAQIALNNKLMDEEEALLANKSLIAEKKALQAEANNEALIAYRREQDAIKLNREKVSIVQKELDLLKQQDAIRKKENDLALKQRERERNLNRIPGVQNQREALKDQIKTAEADLSNRIALIEKERDMKRANIALEYMLLDAKYEFLAAEAKQLSDELRAPKFDKDGNQLPQDPNALAVAESLDKSADTYRKLRGALGANELSLNVNVDTGALEVKGDKGLLSQILGVYDREARQSIDEARDDIVDLKQKLMDLEPVSMALDAAFETLGNQLGDTLNDIVDGAKSAKEAFADLATSILNSFRKVLIDNLAESFLNTLASEFPSIGKLFKRKAAEGAAEGAEKGGSVTVAGTSIPDPSSEKPPGVSSTSFANGLDGQGLGVTKPAWVTMNQTAGPGGPNIPESAGGGAIKDANDGKNSAQTKATEEQTAATTKNTQATLASNLQTASMITGSLATVAALTGNEEAARKLAIITALLQTAVLANTIATQINTGTGFFGGARRGAVFSGTSTKNLAGYATGGVAKGAQGGYPAILHGTEAVVPLPNGKSIPVEMSGSGAGMQQNNVSVNVVMNSDGSSDTDTTGKDQGDLGKRIASFVQAELQNQKRQGGSLSGVGAI